MKHARIRLQKQDLFLKLEIFLGVWVENKKMDVVTEHEGDKYFSRVRGGELDLKGSKKELKAGTSEGDSYQSL